MPLALALAAALPEPTGMPHGYCLLWDTPLVLLHAVSDGLIAIAYLAIPASLVAFLRARRDVPFHWMFIAFAMFILACGTTHLMGVWNIWQPTWWATGIVKAITAAASLVTAGLLIKLIPVAVALPSPAQLRAANLELEAQIRERERAEAALRDARDELEQRVVTRTAELARERARLAAVLAQLPVGVVIAVPPGEVVQRNAQAHRLLGLAPDDDDRDATHLFPADLIDRVLARGETVLGESLTLPGTVTDDERELLVNAGPVRDEQGTLVAAVAAVMDVTEQRRLEDQLRQAAKMEALGRMAGGLAHDFNGALTALTGLIAFEQRAEQDAERGADLAMARTVIDRMAGLTRQLLTFSRKRALADETLDLNAAVREAEGMLRPLLRGSHTLRLEPDAAPLWVRGDRAQLAQVLLNLVLNARDAMPSGGTITVSTVRRDLAAGELDAQAGIVLRPGTYALLRVHDAGEGIAPELLRSRRLFEPFFTTKPEGRGTGLGLATVQAIAHEGGGAVWAESDPRTGTTFVVALPLAQAPAGLPAPPAANGAVPAQQATRLLLTDDDEVVRRVLARGLRRCGFEVVEAGDGREALAELERGPPPALLVSDVMMPGLGGRAFASELRARFPGLPVLWVSGYPPETILPAGESLPHWRFLGKPFQPDELVHAVRALLAVQTALSAAPPARG